MIRAIVTDIEGTTSSISFVHDVLFPYARAHLREFVLAHVNDPDVAAQLAAVRESSETQLDTEGVIQQLLQWIDEDRKVTPLKVLQGLIWEQGYRDGDFHGHIYADAYENLQRWYSQGIRLYIYSSGSVYAQKLLFGHTEHGDMTPLFFGYFDTQTGAKQETASYQQIVNALKIPADEILFLSDTRAELDAAHAAGLKTCWLVREAEPAESAAHPQVQDFNGIDLHAFNE